MGLATKSSYILACYTSLALKYDWDAATVCKCSNAAKVDDNEELRRHHCPTHRDFKPHLLCSSHLECNDPVTRSFLMAKACSEMAEECPEYRTEYRDRRVV